MKKTRKAALLASMLLASSALIFTGCPTPTAPDVNPGNGSEQGNNNGGQTGGDEGKDDVIDISSYDDVTFIGASVWWNEDGNRRYEIDGKTKTVVTANGASGCFDIKEKVAAGDKLVINYTATNAFKFKPVAPDEEIDAPAGDNQFVYEYEKNDTFKQLGIIGASDEETTITLKKVVLIKVDTNEILADVIAAATELKDSAVPGTAVGEYPEEAINAFDEVIKAAAAYKEESHTRAEYDEVAMGLEEAMVLFKECKISPTLSSTVIPTDAKVIFDAKNAPEKVPANTFWWAAFDVSYKEIADANVLQIKMDQDNGCGCLNVSYEMAKGDKLVVSYYAENTSAFVIKPVAPDAEMFMKETDPNNKWNTFEYTYEADGSLSAIGFVAKTGQTVLVDAIYIVPAAN